MSVGKGTVLSINVGEQISISLQVQNDSNNFEITVSEGIATCATGVVACGTVDPTLKDTSITLYNDTSSFDKDCDIDNCNIYINGDGVVNENDRTKTYNIYFWLDSGTLVAADIGKSFSGYIHASAIQGD